MDAAPTDRSLDTAQLIEILAQSDRGSAFFASASRILDQRLVAGPGLPDAIPPGPRKTLSIGMATYDDYDGVYFSVQAIRIFHPEITECTEILVLDNHPEGTHAEALKALEKHVPGYRYIPVNTIRGTAVRDRIFREANADCVLCMDSHVLFPPGALRRLISYFEAHPATRDLLQGPLLADDLHTLSTHFEPRWSEGMWGVWGADARAASIDAEPFEIPMQGLGVFACRRDAWPGFNPRFTGFGGEEGYLHEKFRQAGGNTLCLPFLQWVHRFNRPSRTPYNLNWHDRIRNYWIAFRELGLDTTPIEAHFEQHLGPEPARAILAAVKRETAGPFHFFDAIYCINLDRDSARWAAVTAQFERLGIAHSVRRFPAIETPINHHIGCALSHRAVLRAAQKHGFRNVLVLEDDVVFAENAIEELALVLAGLARQPSWSTLYLGGHRWGVDFEKATGSQHLEIPHGLTCTHAIAYHQSIYARILADIPETPSAVALWLRDEMGIDQYLARALDGLHLLASPAIASQASIAGQESRPFPSPPSIA